MVTHRDFVMAWVDNYKKGTGIPGIAKQLDMTTVSVSAKANVMRRKGVRLPHMPRSRQAHVTVEELNKLIDLKLS